MKFQPQPALSMYGSLYGFSEKSQIFLEFAQRFLKFCDTFEKFFLLALLKFPTIYGKFSILTWNILE